VSIDSLKGETMPKYSMRDFLKINEVNTDGNYPDAEYIQFLRHFENVSFESPKVVKSLSVSLANPSNNRICNARLFGCTIDEYDACPVGKKTKHLVGRLQLTLWRDKGPVIDDSYFYDDNFLNSL
jgi:hypothetical protein